MRASHKISLTVKWAAPFACVEFVPVTVHLVAVHFSIWPIIAFFSHVGKSSMPFSYRSLASPTFPCILRCDALDSTGGFLWGRGLHWPVDVSHVTFTGEQDTQVENNPAQGHNQPEATVQAEDAGEGACSTIEE